MKKLKLLIYLFLLAIIALSIYLYGRFSYANEEVYLSSGKDKTENTVVAIIGDSWVAGQKLDSLLYSNLQNSNIENKIISSGHPGARARKIYQNLFKESGDFSSRFILENRPDYCVVIAGVNDSGSAIGKKNYSHHVQLIIKALLANGIKPIVVEVPEFDVEMCIKTKNPLSRTRDIITSYFNNDGRLDCINDYRKRLRNDLISSNLLDSIIMVDFDKVSQDYHKNKHYYSNYNHLSKEGNRKLAEVISEYIIEDFK